MTYTEYRNFRQGGFNSLPIFWAFSQSQFKEAMEQRGLTENDTDKIFSLGMGGYALKSDREVIDAFLNAPDPLPDLMADPAFAEEAFYYEMCNHEFGINWQGAWDVCSCFGDCEYDSGKSGQDYLADMGYGNAVITAWFRALRRYERDAEKNEWF